MRTGNASKSPFNPFVKRAGLVPFLGALVGLAFHGGVTVTAQDAPRFSSIQVRTNGETVLSLSAVAGQRYQLDASTDLTAWNTLATLAGASTLQHVDAGAAAFDARFYRARQLADSTAFTGDHVATTNGDVIIHPINHASLVLQWNGHRIHIDPVGGAAPYASLPKADLILVTHDHGDHFNAGTLDAVRQDGTVILTPAAVYSRMSTALRSLTTTLTNGVITNLLDLTVEAVPAYNANHSPGVGNGYVVTLGGRRLYFSGDTGDIAEMRALTLIDVAFVCMNVPFTMTVTQAASAVREFRPAIVYPYHYRNQDGSFADLEAFKRQVGAEIEVRLGKWY